MEHYLQHYFPGENVSIPWAADIDTRAFDTLPWVDREPHLNNGGTHSMEKGFDEALAAAFGSNQEPQMAYGAMYNIVGEGHEVTFLATAHTPDSLYDVTGGPLAGDVSLGIIMVLFQPGFSGITEPPLPAGWIAYRAALPAGKFDKNASITWPLNGGETYYLVITSASSYDLAYEDVLTPAPPGPPVLIHQGWQKYGQLFHVDFRYTQQYTNDHRDSATDVIIAADGGTYHTPTAGIVNDTLTYSPDGPPYADDPPSGIGDFGHTAWWVYQPSSDGTFSAHFTIEPADFPYGYMTIYREQPDGSLLKLNQAWNVDIAGVAGTRYFIQLGVMTYFRSAGQIYHLSVTGKRSGPQAPKNPNKYIPTPIPPDLGGLPVDKFDPLANQTAQATGEDTLLNLVRAFSSAVKRPVRITGPTTIEMVNPAVPVPAGLTSSAGIYHAASRASAATDVVLSVSAGDVTVTGSADLIADDDRLVRSSWRIPDRLPFYGLPAAPVQRVTMTFSPQGFNASVDFHFPDVPFAARRP